MVGELRWERRDAGVFDECGECGTRIHMNQPRWETGATTKHLRTCVECGPDPDYARPDEPRSDLPIQIPVTNSPPRGDGCTGHAAAKKQRPYRDLVGAMPDLPEPDDEWVDVKECRPKPEPEHAVAGIDYESWLFGNVLNACIGRQHADHGAAQSIVDEAVRITRIALKARDGLRGES